MIKIVNKVTLEVMDARLFLSQFKNINSASIEVTQELVETLDENAVLVTVDEPPQYVDKIELLELSKPIFFEGKPVLFWEIKRLGKEHINDYFNNAVEEYIDNIAKSRGWKNQDRMVSNLTSTNANYAQEARYMLYLRDKIWEKALPIINGEVEELIAIPERRPLPITQLIAELPVWKMPAGY